VTSYGNYLNLVEKHPSRVNVGCLVNPPHVALRLAFAGLSNVVSGLHSHERVHLHSKSFLDAERHVPGKVSLAVEQAQQHGPGNMKRANRRRYRKACRLDNLRLDEISGMGMGSPYAWRLLPLT
jgi:hypothetical protein